LDERKEGGKGVGKKGGMYYFNSIDFVDRFRE